MKIKREIQIPIKKHFFLFGPRQTGKSTLLKERFPPETTLYYDLLHSDTYRRLAARPELLRLEVQAALKQKKISQVVLDEIQRAPELLNEVHSLIEELSGSGCSFILSGSSARKLKRAHANMLGGRAWTFQLFPLSYQELGGHFELKKALRFGLLPSVYLADDDGERIEILRSYVGTYLKEEVELEAQIRNLSGFLRFLPLVAAQNGEVVNYSNIARETGVKQHTVRSYFEILEDTLLGFFLLPFNKSVRKRMARHPKFYFFDSGVVRSLEKNLATPLDENQYEFGRAFEHFFLCEVMKINEYGRKDWNLSFYRTERGSEVDLIIETPSKDFVAVEIKSTIAPASTHCRGLRSFKEVVPGAELLLACRASHPLEINGVKVLPWLEALDFLQKK